MSQFELSINVCQLHSTILPLLMTSLKCKNCTLCRRACADVMSVLDYYDLESTGDVPMCIHCGQCAAACPFDSMHARSELDKVKAAVVDPNKIVVIQTAPAVRVAIGEALVMSQVHSLKAKWLAPFVNLVRTT